MPREAIPLRKTDPRQHRALHPENNHALHGDDASLLNSSSPVHVSAVSSRQLSRTSSPFSEIPRPRNKERHSVAFKEPESPESASDLEFDDWDEGMPSDLRPELDRDGGRAHSPLLGHKTDEGSPRPPLSRKSTFHERDPESQAKFETRRRYTYAGIFLALSLVSFTVQTETAVYIQHELKWEKPYCML
jgi:hypothetical protein